jgi:hypothetical protein
MDLCLHVIQGPKGGNKTFLQRVACSFFGTGKLLDASTTSSALLQDFFPILKDTRQKFLFFEIAATN